MSSNEIWDWLPKIAVKVAAIKAENNMLKKMLIEKGIIDQKEFDRRFLEEAGHDVREMVKEIASLSDEEIEAIAKSLE